MLYAPNFNVTAFVASDLKLLYKETSKHGSTLTWHYHSVFHEKKSKGVLNTVLCGRMQKRTTSRRRTRPRRHSLLYYPLLPLPNWTERFGEKRYSVDAAWNEGYRAKDVFKEQCNRNINYSHCIVNCKSMIWNATSLNWRTGLKTKYPNVRMCLKMLSKSTKSTKERCERENDLRDGIAREHRNFLARGKSWRGEEALFR